MLKVKGDDELIHEYVVPDPSQLGPVEVRLKDFGIHVWAIVGDLRAYGFDIKRVAEVHGLPPEYVRAALAYYRQHADIIDGRLRENEG
jgi:uncharacterized protein (DUF433 family)